MNRFRLSATCLFTLTALTLALGQKPIAVIPLTSAVQNAFIDRPGDLYLQLEDGSIRKYDKQGKLLQTFQQPETIAVFDPRDGSRAFTYSRVGGWYSFALFGNINKNKLPEEFGIDPWMVCSSGDKNYWLFDAADFSVKRINNDLHRIDSEYILPKDWQTTHHDVVSMREYQGFLFILHRVKGIGIFNSMGKHLKTLSGRDIPYFNFLGEEIYYPLNQQLHFYDLFDASVHLQNLPAETRFVLLSDERVFSVYPNKLEVAEFKP